MNPVADAINSFVGGIIDTIMKAIWAAGVWLLRSAFGLADSFTGFTLADPQTGRISADSPISSIWPLMLWISGVIALGLFFYQLIATMVHGGRGFWRAAGGPFAYAVAMASTVGVVALVLITADGLTTALLQAGLRSNSFTTVLDTQPDVVSGATALGGALDSTTRAVLLGVVALFGVIPAALGYLLEMVFRQAVILVLVATIPITAAGLLAQTSASWFWRSVRWILAAVLMKPALALVLVIGVGMLSRPTGVVGLLAGVGVLLIALFCPFTLFRLLAFVEPGTGANATMRSWSPSTSREGANTSSGTDAAEATNTSRFAHAMGSVGGAVGAAAGFATNYANTTMDATGIGWAYGGSGGSTAARNHSQRSDADAGGGTGDGGGGGGGGGDSGPNVTNVNVFGGSDGGGGSSDGGGGGSGGAPAPQPPRHSPGGGAAGGAGEAGAAGVLR